LQNFTDAKFTVEDLTKLLPSILTDPITGLATSKSLHHALSLSVNTNAKYVDLDIRNLGGLNAYRGSIHLANKDLKRICSIVTQEVETSFLEGEIIAFRQGGDSFLYLFVLK